MGTPTYEHIAAIDFQSSNSGYTPTFSNIPQTYRHLEIVISGRMSPAYFFGMALNGVTTNSYTWMGISQDQGNGTYGDGNSTATSQINTQNNVNQSLGDLMGSLRLQINDYTSTKNKVVLLDYGGAGTGSYQGLGRFATSSAITSVTMYPGYVWYDGRIDLYGLVS